MECKDNYPIIKIINENKNCYKENLNVSIGKNITNLLNQFDKSFIDNGNNIEIKEGNIIYTLTNTENQKKSFENKNETSINLGMCENEIKTHYNISKNSFLYIFKKDIFINGMKIPKIEYEVYFPFNNETLTKLNLTICKDIKKIY